MHPDAHARSHRPAFGRWLLTQAKRDDQVGYLAKAAAADRAFPRDGDAEAASRRLNAMQADGEMHAALDQAEIDYHAY